MSSNLLITFAVLFLMIVEYGTAAVDDQNNEPSTEASSYKQAVQTVENNIGLLVNYLKNPRNESCSAERFDNDLKEIQSKIINTLNKLVYCISDYANYIKSTVAESLVNQVYQAVKPYFNAIVNNTDNNGEITGKPDYDNILQKIAKSFAAYLNQFMDPSSGRKY
ncbi:hypothetical protein O3M35_007891 [Rhynocoris fuscipes]|uniref:Uncharacterized protein n=1 Tax=Rhynocoris fuscipes TaxID=488301 RepID=A0AAW1DDL3_9HEMI